MLSWLASSVETKTITYSEIKQLLRASHWRSINILMMLYVQGIIKTQPHSPAMKRKEQQQVAKAVKNATDTHAFFDERHKQRNSPSTKELVATSAACFHLVCSRRSQNGACKTTEERQVQSSRKQTSLIGIHGDSFCRLDDR